MRLQEYLDVIWRRKFLILFVALLGPLAVWLVGEPTETEVSNASSKLTMALKAGEQETQLLLYSSVASDTNTIANAVAEELGENIYDSGFSTAEMVRVSVGLQADTTVGTMELFIVNQPDIETAELVLTTYSDELVEYARGRETIARDQQLESLRQREVSLLGRIEGLEADLEQLVAQQTAEQREQRIDPDRVKTAQLGSNLATLTSIQTEIAFFEDLTDEELTPLQLISAPESFVGPTETSSIGTRQRTVIGAALALVLAIGLAFALHHFDGRLFTRKDTEAGFRLPVLAEIPKMSWRTRRKAGVIARTEPSSAIAESFRLLRSSLAHARSLQVGDSGSAPNLLSAAERELGTVIIVTSVAAGTGKTTTLANLAVASVDAGNSVLVINADLREPAFHRHIGPDHDVGIIDAVHQVQSTGAAKLEDYVVPSDLPGISLLAPGGSVSNPGDALARLDTLIDQAKRAYEIILIDTPSMLAGNDVNELVRFADLILMTARSGQTTLDEAQWAEETASRLNAPMAGVALIGARSAVGQRKRPLLSRFRTSQTRPDSYGSQVAPPEAVQLGAEYVASAPPQGTPDEIHTNGQMPSPPQSSTPVEPVAVEPVAVQDLSEATVETPSADESANMFETASTTILDIGDILAQSDDAGTSLLEQPNGNGNGNGNGANGKATDADRHGQDHVESTDEGDPVDKEDLSAIGFEIRPRETGS